MNTPQFLNILKNHIHNGGKVVVNDNYCFDFQDKSNDKGVRLRIFNQVQGYWHNLNEDTIKKVNLVNNMFDIDTTEDSLEIILVKEVSVEKEYDTY